MKKFLFKLSSIFAIASSSIAILSSCSNNLTNPLIFANFEAYMSEDLKSRLKSEFNELKFDFYTSNENMITNFKNGTYTIGNASTYAIIELINENLLESLDWSKFNLKDPLTQQPIQTPDQALSLFIQPVQDILTGFKGADGSSLNLLKYCVPYFFQSYIFAYRGPVINAFNDPNITWNEILNLIGSNNNVFNNGRLGAVEDERTLFSVANLVNSSNQNVNPPVDLLKPQTNEYIEIFENFSNGNKINQNTLGRNPIPIFLNSDSSIILNKLATNSLNGTMLFNGDAIFAAQGGEDSLNKLPTSNDFHFVTPKYTPLALDCLIVNKKNVIDSERAKKTYEILYKTALEGSDSNDPTDFQKTNEKNLYTYGPMLNFSFVQYVSPLNIISGNETNINSVVYTTDYFDNPDDPELTKAIKNAYTISPPSDIPITNLIETPLNSWQKQALIQAFARFKENTWG